jgi:long-chain acyl-CoA synthetase
MHPDIEACAVAGAHLAQPLGLVMLSQEAVARSAAPNEREALTTSLTAHLATVNAELEPHERMDCLVVITTAWTPENGFVTPTLKVKRMRIEEAYASHYQEWLGQRIPVAWSRH